MAAYTGPSVREMIATHTLASQIVARADDACPILDEAELALLRRFVTAPAALHDAAARHARLAEHGMADAPGDAPGTAAQATAGSLVGFAIATYDTERPALTEDEVQLLRQWFDGQ